MNLKPLGDRVVVEREEAKDTTAGGIVLPDTAKDKPQKGKVARRGRRPGHQGRQAPRAAGQGRRQSSCSPPTPARSSSSTATRRSC